MSAYLKKLDDFLAEKNPVTDALGQVEEKTGVKKQHQAFAIIGIVLLWFIVGYGASLLCSVIGFIYPAYRSLKALESADTEDDHVWLVYWVVYSFFSFGEFFSDFLLSWIPFYYLLKCAFLVWCMIPGPANGSMILYERVIRPVFLKHEKDIDRLAAKTLDSAKDLQADASSIAQSATEQLTELGTKEALRQMQQGAKKDD